jgi:putative nucleotidyltransferase with HDIG domain
MKNRTTPFIIAVAGAAATVAMLLPAASEATASKELTAIAVLVALALAAELLAYVMPAGTTAAISSMPALAAVLVSPTWHVVAAMALVKSVAESVRRADFDKAVFNIAQYSLAVGLAALVFLGMGGESLLNSSSYAIGYVTSVYGLPAFVAFATAVTSNTLLVSTVISLSTGASLSRVWHTANVLKIGVDIIASPLIFLFAWAYVRFGPIAAAAFWVPIIGLRQVYKANMELEQTNVELLDLMVKSIEARDVYTSGHSRRVQNYSIQIARALALPEREIEMIGRAALLHDVGKIYEKYGPILQKADRLTPEEWSTMRHHPIDGAELIATMTRLRELVAPIRHHHENWDGTGYPDGLAGNMIPLPARVIRFADTIDAMTTERPYRPPLNAEDVRAEIVRHRGSQFDPQIVDRLLSSPIWRSMLSPVEAQDTNRFGELAVVSKDGKRPRIQTA